MPLPVTPSYRERLIALRSYNPKVADLAARIAQAIKPEALELSESTLEGELFDRLQAVGQQRVRCVTRLSAWFSPLLQGQALQHAEAAAFLNEAACLGGPSGVVPE
ncbi:hypothetical protein KZH41_23430 [Pseudomonas sp. YeP6b]|uniref:hypothetical protein n=1 Tax=Pseudomonas sp. YeP6b TaxID=2861775 RepID=UPI0021DAD556|nr:hypothetical protein [Pseudomonas sp. YeP6b]UXZ21412.1 hypothetical protein KZH41_23430 [Pseudomonas sp. YeP6b]